jgi:phage-related protein
MPQPKLILKNGGEVILPAEFILDGWSSELSIPAVQIEGRDGEIPDLDAATYKPRDISIRGVIYKDTPEELEEQFRLLVSQFYSTVKLYQTATSDKYINVNCTTVAHSFVPMSRQTAAEISAIFRASDPFVYEDEATTVLTHTGDSFRVEAENPNASGGNVKIDYVGTWAENTNANCSGGKSIYSTKPGDYTEIIFYGSGITWYSIISTNVRKADVYLDGVFQTTVDLYSSTTVFQFNAFSVSGLTPGQHVLKIVVALGTNDRVHIDAFDIIGSSQATIDNSGSVQTPVKLEITPIDSSYKADFLGKTAGSVTDNKHKALTKIAATADAPSTFSTELVQDEYDKIRLKEGNSSSLSTTLNTQYPRQLFQFDRSDLCGGIIDKVKQYTREIAIRWFGWGEGQNGQARDYTSKIYAWNARTGVYDELGTSGMSFTRNSTAYKADGSVVPANQPRFELGRFHNLLTKNQSDVETDITGFNKNMGTETFARDTTEKWEGAASLKIVTTSASAGQGVYLGFTATTGKIYTASVYVKGPSGTLRLSCANYTTDITLTGSWQRVSVTTPALASGGSKFVSLVTPTAQAITFYVDGLQLNEGGLIAWQPGGTGKSIQIEEGAANILQDGGFEQWTDSSTLTKWTKFGSAEFIFSQESVNKASGAYCVKVNCQNTSTAVRIQQTVNVNPDTNYTFTVKIKGDAVLKPIFYIFTTSYGVITSKNITLTANAPYQRLDLTFNSGSNSQVIVAMYPNYTAGGAAGNIYFDDAQIEAKAYSTSFTDGTRAGEVLSIPGNVLNPSEGTIACWVNMNDLARRQVAGVYQRIFCAKNLSGTNSLTLYHQDTLPNWILSTRDDANNVTMVTIADSYTPDGWRHIAIKWNASEAKVLIDGVTRGTIANPKLSTAYLSPMYFGCDNTYDKLGAPIDDLIVYNVAKTDAEIAALYSSNAPAKPDASTVYYQSFGSDTTPDNGSLAGVMPFEKVIAANVADYIDENGKINILVRPTYPADGTNSSAIYTDYTSAEVKHCYLKLGEDVIQNKGNGTTDPIQPIEFNPAIELGYGDVIEIDGEHFKATKNEASILGKLNNGFLANGFNLLPGANVLEFEPDPSSTALLQATIKYKPRYY